MVNIIRYDNVLWINSIQHKEITVNFIFYNIQRIPKIILFIYVYIIALSITKLCTICQCLWIMFQMKFYMF